MDSREFQRKRRRERFYDRVHIGFVKTCMGLTALGSLYIGYMVYEYFRYVRPLKVAQSKVIDDELLLEGRNQEDSANIELST